MGMVAHDEVVTRRRRLVWPRLSFVFEAPVRIGDVEPRLCRRPRVFPQYTPVWAIHPVRPGRERHVRVERRTRSRGRANPPDPLVIEAPARLVKAVLAAVGRVVIRQGKDPVIERGEPRQHLENVWSVLQQDGAPPSVGEDAFKIADDGVAF